MRLNCDEFSDRWDRALALMNQARDDSKRLEAEVEELRAQNKQLQHAPHRRAVNNGRAAFSGALCAAGA